MRRRHRAHLPDVVVALVALAAALFLSPSAAAVSTPFASGDDAANVPHDSSRTWVLQRWVAKRTGVLDRLYFYAKVEGSDACAYGGRSGYAGGTSGRLLATTHPVLPGGAPDMSRTLARSEFTPCGNDNRETVAIDLGIAVTAGQELATVVRNVDTRPSDNYFSSNFLFQESGLSGANGRNERDPAAADAYYGLDPRELVGYSIDGGRTWSLPGGPYGGGGGRSFLPTYIQQYADGVSAGQPYYWTRAASGDVTMVFPRVPQPWTIDSLGAYTASASSGTVVLSVDGAERARATLSGRGFLRAAISPVTVAPGQTVSVSTRAGSGGLSLRRMEVDAFWAGKLGLGTGYRHFSAEDPPTAVTVYPLPAYWAPPPPSIAPGGAGGGGATTSPASPLSLRAGARPRAVFAAVRSRLAGRVTVTVLARRRVLARCANLRVGVRRRAECRVVVAGGRPLGRLRVVARARLGGSLQSRALTVGRGGPRAGRPASVGLRASVARRRAVVRGRARPAGRMTLVARAPARRVPRCVRTPRRSVLSVSCRVTGPAAASGADANLTVRVPRRDPVRMRLRARSVVVRS